jgi:LPXTG-site transpeptidase (sortase) family protein
MNTKTNNNSLLYRTAAVFMIVMLMLAAMPVSPAYADDTGLRAPSANNNVSWTNPQNAYTSDNNRAVADSMDDIVQYSNFGFPAFPVGATITGIEVLVEGYQSGGGTPRQADISLSSNNGVTYTTGTTGTNPGIRTTNMPGTNAGAEAVRTFGTPTSTWNRTWATGDFANFRVRLDTNPGSNGSTLNIDRVQVRVTYTAPVAPTSFTSANVATFTVGIFNTFTVVANGSPSPAYTVTAGTLPTGITLGSTGTLSGTPAAGTVGAYPITITATNVSGTATQAFILTVQKANTTTTINSDLPDPSPAGQNVGVTYTVASAGNAIARTGNVTVSDGTNDCVAAASAGTCSLALMTVGNRTLIATYAGDANFNGSASSSATPNHTVTASYGITASAGANGTITPAGSVSVAHGANQTFSSAPNPTFILSDVLVDGASVGRANSYTFNAVTVDHTIAASFNGGWYAPAASANVVSVPNPDNAFASDNAFATYSYLGERADYSTFGIPAIPSGATINGIEVAVEGYCATVNRNAEIYLSWDGGTNVTTITPARTTTLSATDSTLILGGAADTWGRTWSNTDFTNAKFVVRARSTGGGTSPVYIDQIQVRVTYTLPASAPIITSLNTTTFTAGIAGNFNVIATGSPVPTFTVTTGTLPTGVTLSTAGVLSGTPATGTVGTYPITIRASNTSGSNDQAFTLTVQKANTTTTINSDLPDPSLAGQNVVVTYAVVSAGNALTPAGNVTVSDGVNNCVDTAAAGTCTLALTTVGSRTLTATYAGDTNFNGSASSSATPNHTVNSAPPTITSLAPSGGSLGAAYIHTYTADGSAPIMFSVSSGSLPTGLTLTSAGAISGIPTALGTFSGTVTAANGTAPDATQNFSITISLTPVIISADNASFTLGMAGTFTVAATGSPTPILSMAGTLPSGVTFVPATGVLSGTPAVGTNGSYPLTFTAANGILPDAIQNFTLTVSEGPSITSVDHATFSLGLPGTFSVTAVGSPTPILSIVGTLPTGVTFTPATGILAGTPAAGTVGSYPLIFNAVNGILPNATQNFTLTVKNGPIVALSGINSVPDTGNSSISENESIVNTLGITKLKVKFDQDVYDDPSNITDYAKDVTNPANYMLVLGSASGAFQTVSCLGGVVLPDVAIAVDSVTYNNNGGAGPFVATLNINGGLPLNAVGYYRLYVCGTTSIVDAADVNLKLAGNGITPGTDFALNFRVQATGTDSSVGSGDGSSGAKKKSVFSSVSSTALIPVTGFAPNKVTALPAQPASKAYMSLGEIRIEIPTLGINFPIVGVAVSNNSWDLTWLKDSVAYLDGSAYPTLAGNTVLTAHVVDANNNLGPFSDIKGMQLGQKVYIHAYGQVYVYQVQENRKLLPTSLSTVFKHEEYDWITLVTCEDYNVKTASYKYRRMVRAVLISVIPEK